MLLLAKTAYDMYHQRTQMLGLPVGSQVHLAHDITYMLTMLFLSNTRLLNGTDFRVRSRQPHNVFTDELNLLCSVHRVLNSSHLFENFFTIISA